MLELKLRPANPMLITPSTFRALFGPNMSSSAEVSVLPTSFGAREPTLPVARTMTLARIATPEGVDKRYERAWLRGLKSLFTAGSTGKNRDENGLRMVKRGDIFSIPVWRDKPVASDGESEEEESSSDSDEEGGPWTSRADKRTPTALAYFTVTSLSYEPLNPLDEDFRSTTSSKARAGELGCWVDVGEQGATRMVLTGVERAVLPARSNEQIWHGLGQLDFGALQSSADDQESVLSHTTRAQRAVYGVSSPPAWPMPRSAVPCSYRSCSRAHEDPGRPRWRE